MSNPESPLNEDEERGLDALLREIGPRERPSSEVTRVVYQAVHAEWEEVVSRRRSGRQAVVGFAIAATVAGLSLALWLGMPQKTVPETVIAQVGRVAGAASMLRPTLKDEKVLTANVAIQTHDRVRTAADARVALRLAEDFSVRLDENTEVEFADETHLTLRRGAVFIDDDPRPPNHALKVTTPLGDISHLGTQYEVRVDPDSLRVRVREGEIQLRSSEGSVTAKQGEQLMVSMRGVARESIPVFGPQWQWSQQISPAFEIENHSVEEFLKWAVRETGRQLVYASPLVEEEARRVILHGSVTGLGPESAVAAVLSTTRFTHTQSADRIVLALSP